MMREHARASYPCLSLPRAGKCDGRSVCGGDKTQLVILVCVFDDTYYFYFSICLKSKIKATVCMQTFWDPGWNSVDKT